VNDYVAYRKSCRIANRTIVASRGNFYNDRIQTAAADPRRRCVEIRHILHLITTCQIRSDDDYAQLSCGFSAFFADKIRRTKDAIRSRLGNTFEDPLLSDVRHVAQMFTDITPPSTDEIYRLIRLMPAKSSPLEKIPTSVIKTCVKLFAPLIA
jgi:hypothetical protein